MSKRVLCLVTLAALWVGVPFAYAQPRSAQADCDCRSRACRGAPACCSGATLL